MSSISAETISQYPALAKSGLFHRRSTEGQEKNLVDTFIATQLSPPPAGQVRFIFVEPRLETGFPDVVVVYLDLAAAKSWKIDRAGMSKREICLLHHLVTNRAQEQDDLRLRTLFPQGLDATLAKLQSVGMIRSTRNGWTAYSPRTLMAVRRIVAIEAKVGAWRPGLDQAYMNRWFASESYLLLPERPKSSELAIEMQATGVGLLTANTPLGRPLIRAQKTKLPGSYATWLFNEWACHARCTVKASPKRDAASRHDLRQVPPPH